MATNVYAPFNVCSFGILFQRESQVLSNDSFFISLMSAQRDDYYGEHDVDSDGCGEDRRRRQGDNGTCRSENKSKHLVSSN